MVARLALPPAILALTGCAARQPAHPPVVFESEEWKLSDTRGRKLTTPHYEIYTTLRDGALVQALPEFLETALEHYRQLVPPARGLEPASSPSGTLARGMEPASSPSGSGDLPVSGAARMTVYILVSRGQWLAFTRQLTGPRTKIYVHIRNGGYTDQGVVVMEYVRHDITFPILAHEGFHQYLHYHVGDTAPAWLNEGLAVAAEGHEMDLQGRAKFNPAFNPKRRNDLAEALVGNRLHALRELLRTNAGEVITGSDRSVAAYYAQLWALTLFLRDGAGGKYAAGFGRLLDSLGRPELESHAKAAHIWSEEADYSYGESLFRSFINEDVDAVEREYVEYVRTLAFAKR